MKTCLLTTSDTFLQVESQNRICQCISHCKRTCTALLRRSLTTSNSIRDARALAKTRPLARSMAQFVSLVVARGGRGLCSEIRMYASMFYDHIRIDSDLADSLPPTPQFLGLGDMCWACKILCFINHNYRIFKTLHTLSPAMRIAHTWAKMPSLLPPSIA